MTWLLYSPLGAISYFQGSPTWCGASCGKMVELHVNGFNSFFHVFIQQTFVEDPLMCAKPVRCSLGSADQEVKAMVPESVEPRALFKDSIQNLLF